MKRNNLISLTPLWKEIHISIESLIKKIMRGVPKKWKIFFLAGLLIVSVWIIPVNIKGTAANIFRNHSLQVIDALKATYTQAQEEESMMDFAKSLGRAGKPVALAIANDAYLRPAHSWLCNTKFMGIHDQIMIIVPEESTRKQLKEQWPEVRVFTINTTLGNIGGARDYTTVGFQRITYFRAQIVKQILSNNIDVFVFEFDAVWFENPLLNFKKAVGNADIVGVKVTGFDVQIAIGLLYIRSTNRTIAVWTQIVQQMDNLLNKFQKATNGKLISESWNDQVFLENMLKAKYVNIQVVHMSGEVYADGKWYTKKKRNPSPVLINNNWVIGVQNKINRAIKYNHWFWNTTLNECDVDLVRKTVRI